MTRFFLFVLVLLAWAGPARADSFDDWLAAFRDDAAAQGISQRTLDAALDGVQPLDRVLALDVRQPERTITFARYRANILNPERIRLGRQYMRQYADLLAQTGDRYGVPPQIIVALWGIETSFGRNTGGFEIVPSLATLAWDGRRAAFFRGELIDALKILDDGDIDVGDMKGSWAGAMGQNQFMPSSFLKFAADGNGDGRRDIWNDRADVFASTANYLAANGWRGAHWGRAVWIPAGLDPSYVTLKDSRSMNEWGRLGLRFADGQPLPDSDSRLSLVAPDGLPGPAFLVNDNYRAIMRWNRSTYFATSVGLLADAFDISGED